MKKLNPIDAAQLFIDMRFRDCDGALLAGSVVRGEATETSDLDIVIFDAELDAPYRESLVESGWAIEVFVNNLDSYKSFFESDRKRARPSLPRMVSEGIVLKDKGIIDGIKNEANALLENGPEIWSADTINTKRYFITDALEDFIGSTIRAEELFIANTLGEWASEFVLRTNGKWIGASKWVVRALKQHDSQFADYFIEAFDAFYRNNDKSKIITLVDEVLEPHGGRLFEGFSVGKK